MNEAGAHSVDEPGPFRAARPLLSMMPTPPHSAAPRLSIIIVNYNGRAFIRNCLDSVREFAPADTEVIVVDNDSRDGSAEIIRTEFPWVHLIESGANLGFTGGNNLGAAQASGKWLLLLNNDTILQTPLEPVLAVVEAGDDIGVVGCRLVYADGSQQESIGRELTPAVLILGWTPLSRFPAFRRSLHRGSDAYGRDGLVCAWVSGAFLLTPSKLWKDLGGLDAAYFMYMEDVDYCKRVRQRGYNVIYTNKSTVVHLEGAGRAWIGERALLNSVDSYMIYCSKFYGSSCRLALSTVLALVFFLRSAAFGLLYLTTRNAIMNEKQRGFRRAASRLFSAFFMSR